MTSIVGQNVYQSVSVIESSPILTTNVATQNFINKTDNPVNLPNVNISGNLTVQGTTTTIDNVNIQDPLLKCANNNSGDGINSGIYTQYNDGATKYTGLIRNKDDKSYYLFTNQTTEPTNTDSLTFPSLADLRTGNLTIPSPYVANMNEIKTNVIETINMNEYTPVGFTEEQLTTNTNLLQTITLNGELYEFSSNVVDIRESLIGKAFCAFDHDLTKHFNTINYSSGAYTGGASTTYTNLSGVSNQSYSGNWLQIKLPRVICCKRFYIRVNLISRGPSDFLIVGSNNGTNWNEIQTYTGQTWGFTGQMRTYELPNNKKFYQYYRMVINSIVGGSQMNIGEWHLFDYQTITADAKLEVVGDIDIKGQIYQDGVPFSSGGFDGSQVVNITNTTQSTASNNGALVVAGGVGVAKDVNIDGQTTMNNTVFISSDSTTSFVTYGGGSFAKNLYVNASTNSDSKSTGALVCFGGVGIDKDVYCGGNMRIQGTTDSTSSTTGALVVSGGAGFGSNIHVNGTINSVGFVNTTNINATSTLFLRTANTTRGFFSSAGLTLSTSTESTSVNTGSINTPGGIGCAKNLNVGGDISTTSNRIELRKGLTGKETSAGVIGYEVLTQNFLDIVGAGTTVGFRGVKIHDYMDVEWINASSRISIGGTQNNFALQVFSDSAAKPTTSTWTIFSDVRTKENIIDADLSICNNIIKNLKLKYFKYQDKYITPEQRNNDNHMLGFIAQDVKEYLPKSVKINSMTFNYTEENGEEIKEVIEDFHTLDKDQILMTLYGAVQYLQGFIGNIQKENEGLKNKMATLESQLKVNQTNDMNTLYKVQTLESELMAIKQFLKM